MPGEPRGGWCEGEAFGADYILVYPHRDDPSAAAEVRALRGLVPGLDPGSRVLDLGCGAGRHLRVLGAEGFRAFGCDLSRDLLGEAVRRGTGGLVGGDMRRLPFRSGRFDAVLCFFTSFGYFGKAEEDADVLREAARVLRCGGGLLLDLMDAASVRRDLVPVSERAGPGFRVVEERGLSADGSRVEKRVTLHGDGATRSWTESVRLYDPDEVEAMAADARLAPARRLGGFGPEPWRSGATPRCVLVFEKRAA